MRVVCLTHYSYSVPYFVMEFKNSFSKCQIVTQTPLEKYINDTYLLILYPPVWLWNLCCGWHKNELLDKCMKLFWVYSILFRKNNLVSFIIRVVGKWSRHDLYKMGFILLCDIFLSSGPPWWVHLFPFDLVRVWDSGFNAGAAFNLLLVDRPKPRRSSCSRDCSHVQDW